MFAQLRERFRQEAAAAVPTGRLIWYVIEWSDERPLWQPEPVGKSSPRPDVLLRQLEGRRFHYQFRGCQIVEGAEQDADSFRAVLNGKIVADVRIMGVPHLLTLNLLPARKSDELREESDADEYD